MMPYGDIDLSQYWLLQWLIAWWHQAITWTNGDISSVRYFGIHLRAISRWVGKVQFCKLTLDIIFFKITAPRGQWVDLTYSLKLHLCQRAVIQYFLQLTNMIPWILILQLIYFLQAMSIWNIFQFSILQMAVHPSTVCEVTDKKW